MSKQPITPEQAAVNTGFWRVTAPGYVLMMAFFLTPILWLGRERAFYDPTGLKIWLSSMAAGIVIGWVWWSVAAPRWRLWAYGRVADLDLLQALAVEQKLIWPASHILTRTEWRAGDLGEQLRAFESRMSRAD